MTEEAQEFEAEERVEAEETPEPPEPPKPDYTDDDIAEARAFNWKSPDEWQGEKPPGYIENPKEYVERIKRHPIFREMNERLARQEEAQQETLRKIEGVNKHALQRQREQYERELEEAAARQKKAFDDGDKEAFEAATKRRDELMRNTPQEEPKQEAGPPPPDPMVMEYRQKNDWAKNPVIWQQAAEAVNYRLHEAQTTGERLDTAKQLEIAETFVRETYPHLFKAKPQAQRQTVDPGGLAGGGAKRSAFSQLPKVAQDTFYRQMKDGTWEDTKDDREEYANVYNSQ